MSEPGIKTVPMRKRIGGLFMMLGGLGWLVAGPVFIADGFQRTSGGGRTFADAYPWLVVLGIGVVCMIVGKLIAGPTASKGPQPASESQEKSHAHMD